MDKERRINRNGFLFRYAYWFKAKKRRPETVSLCRLFWRLVFITLLGMPLWWLVWAPFGLAVGFPFAHRPRFLESDGCTDSRNDFPSAEPWDALVPYRHWLRIKGSRILPLPLLLGSFAVWRLGTHTNELKWAGGIVLGLIMAAILLIVIFSLLPEVTNRALETESGRLAKDWVKAKKQRVCPLYKVV